VLRGMSTRDTGWRAADARHGGDAVGLTVIAFTTTDVDRTQSASDRASHARCRVH